MPLRLPTSPLSTRAWTNAFPKSRSAPSKATLLAVILTVPSEMNNKESMLQFYRKIQEVGQSKKKCVGCDRAIHANEKSAFDVYVSCSYTRSHN